MCGTCQNNDYIVVNPQTEPVCINPVALLVSKAVKESYENGSDLTVTIEDVLTRGYTSKNKADFCCPDCTEPTGFYFLGNATAFQLLVDTFITWPDFTGSIECCLNYEGSVSTAVQIETTIGALNSELECCSSTFTADMKVLEAMFTDFSDILNQGVVEISSFGGKSSLVEIINTVKLLNPYYDADYILEVLNAVLLHGIFVKCDDCTILITTAAEAINAVQSIF